MSMKHVMSDTPANLVQTYSRTRANHPVQPLSIWTGLGWRGFQVIDLGRGLVLENYTCTIDSVWPAVHRSSRPHDRTTTFKEGGLAMSLSIDR
jgi:hypothetical protein